MYDRKKLREAELRYNGPILNRVKRACRVPLTELEQARRRLHHARRELHHSYMLVGSKREFQNRVDECEAEVRRLEKEGKKRLLWI